MSVPKAAKITHLSFFPVLQAKMSYFNPKLPLKQVQQSRHPWAGRIKDKYSSTYIYDHNSASNPEYPAKKEITPNGSRIKFTVIGNMLTNEFIYCLFLVKGLYMYRKKLFEAPVIRGVTSVEWPKIWNDLKLQYGPVAYCLRTQVAVLKNDEFLGGSDELKTLVESKYNFNLGLNYEKEKIQQFYNFIKSSGRPCAYMHISINDIPIGPLIFMLYADITPQTCNNFLRLCETKKGGYSGTPIHRIVKDCWIQCGGFGLKDNANLECENFIVPQDRRGILGMANDGRHTDCSTHFYVLLQPAPWMAQKFVAFGQLIEGESILSRIENVQTWYESPTDQVKIDKAGVFNMDCQRIRINKNTIEYLEKHTEDLFELARMLYEEILEKVFATANLRYLDQLREELLMDEQLSVDQAVSDTNTSKRNKRTKDVEKLISDSNTSNIATTDYGGTTLVNDSDIDDFEIYCEDLSNAKVEEDSEISDVGVVKPTKIVYFPLTDVPYPGEVDSTFNFQKLLRGDYCHAADLETDPGKIKKLRTRERSLFSVLKQESEFQPIESVAVSECILDNDSTLLKIDDEELCQYLSEVGDKVSFAGPTIKKIALKSEKNKNLNKVEYDNMPKYCINASSLTQEKKHQEHSRSCAASFPDVDDSSRPSVLARLYEHLAANSDDDAPTLKDYKPHSEVQEQSFLLLTNSPIQPNMRDERFFPPSNANQTEIADSTLGVLGLQHGMKMTRKISTDNTRTMDNIQQKFNCSIRSVQYAKSRPSISIEEYREKNRKYQAEMAAAKNNPALPKDTN